MKRIVYILAMLLLFIAAGDNPRKVYIEKYSKLAVKEMNRTGVPASITLAQGILESNSGQSRLSTQGNNHFGVKCHNDWKGKTIQESAETGKECFRMYTSAEQSFRDHSDFLRGKDRYKFLFDLKPTDYKGWAYGLKKAGYATDPNYPAKLIKIIEDYELYKFDKGVKITVETPAVIETPKVATAANVDRNYKEMITISMDRKLYEQNGVPFVYSIEGESYKSIASSFSLFTKELLSFNDMKKERPLDPGTVVYLARKKKEAAYGIGKYVVGRDGETLWEISQRFGVRLNSLIEYNNFQKVNDLEEGDTIILRKL